MWSITQNEKPGKRSELLFRFFRQALFPAFVSSHRYFGKWIASHLSRELPSSLGLTQLPRWEMVEQAKPGDLNLEDIFRCSANAERLEASMPSPLISVVHQHWKGNIGVHVWLPWSTRYVCGSFLPDIRNLKGPPDRPVALSRRNPCEYALCSGFCATKFTRKGTQQVDIPPDSCVGFLAFVLDPSISWTYERISISHLRQTGFHL